MERKRRRGGGGGGEIRGAYEEKRQHIIIIIIITPWQNESVRGGPMGGEEKGDSSRGKKLEPIRVIWLRGSYACPDHFASHQFAGFYIYTYTVILIIT